MKVSMAIQVLPALQDSKEVCRVVDLAIAEIAKSGLHYVVGPFETTIEGDSMAQMLTLLEKIDQVTMAEGVPSSCYYIKISHGRDKILTIDEKIGKYQKQ